MNTRIIFSQQKCLKYSEITASKPKKCLSVSRCVHHTVLPTDSPITIELKQRLKQLQCMVNRAKSDYDILKAKYEKIKVKYDRSKPNVNQLISKSITKGINLNQLKKINTTISKHLNKKQNACFEKISPWKYGKSESTLQMVVVCCHGHHTTFIVFYVIFICILCIVNKCT